MAPLMVGVDAALECMVLHSGCEPVVLHGTRFLAAVAVYDSVKRSLMRCVFVVMLRLRSHCSSSDVVRHGLRFLRNRAGGNTRNRTDLVRHLDAVVQLLDQHAHVAAVATHGLRLLLSLANRAGQPRATDGVRRRRAELPGQAR